MNQKNGFPDGFSFNSNVPPNYKSEGARRQESQQQSIQELRSSLPPNLVKGNPVLYDDDGIPIIEENIAIHQQPTLEEQVQQTIVNPAVPPKRQRDFDPNQFFTAPAKQQKKESVPVQNKQVESTRFHPVIRKMLNVFGLKKNPLKDLEVYNEDIGDKITYTMTLVSEELQSWAIMEGRNRLVIDPETGTIYFELLFGCCSVVAIDHIPVWEIFGVDLLDQEKNDIANDKFDMSFRIRKISARKLADLLWSDVVPMGDKLVSFYQDKIQGKKIQSSHEIEAINRVRYVCPLDDCGNYEFLTPEENGIEKVYFCKFHGCQLVKTIDVDKELDVPLA